MARKGKNTDTRQQLAFSLDYKLKILESKFYKNIVSLFNRLTKRYINKSVAVSTQDIEQKLKKLISSYQKEITKSVVDFSNYEIEKLSGEKSRITIGKNAINRFLEHEQAAKDAISNFNQLINKQLNSLPFSSQIDKKEVAKTLQHTNRVYRKTLKTITQMQSITNANASRLEAFKKSSLVKGVQFLAILDDRTTLICSARHLQVFKLDDPVLSQYTPPLHYNCRSLLSPVMLNETIKFSEQADLIDTMTKYPKLLDT